MTIQGAIHQKMYIYLRIIIKILLIDHYAPQKFQDVILVILRGQNAIVVLLGINGIKKTVFALI